MLREYWRGKLSASEQKIYDDMLAVFCRYKEEVSCGNLTAEACQRVYAAVTDDHPELFHLPCMFVIGSTTGLFGTNTTLRINNLFDEVRIRAIKQQIDYLCNKLATRLGAAQASLDKEQYVCEYLVDNVTYEINNELNQNAATVLCQHKGQCSGIARATKLLLESLGVETIVVNGTATDTSTGQVSAHAWNIVNIDGGYFHLDVTFMIGANMRKVKPYRFAYFNYSDKDIATDHVWDEGSTPTCNGTLYFTGNNVEVVTRPSVTISSPFELKTRLTKAIVAGEQRLIFQSKLQMQPEQLLSSVEKCCRSVTFLLGKNCAMNIAIHGDVVTISW